MSYFSVYLVALLFALISMLAFPISAIFLLLWIGKASAVRHLFSNNQPPTPSLFLMNNAVRYFLRLGLTSMLALRAGAIPTFQVEAESSSDADPAPVDRSQHSWTGFHFTQVEIQLPRMKFSRGNIALISRKQGTELRKSSRPEMPSSSRIFAFSKLLVYRLPRTWCNKIWVKLD